jgi:dTDP-4-amino-4,6-dideoxygalactose transaminase
MKQLRLVDLAEQHAELRPELDAAIGEVLDSGAYILGPQAAAFEEEYSAHLGVPHTVGCNSGTDALMLALDAVRLRRGPGKVVTTPFTFFATAEAVVQAGHELVFADIEPAGFNLDPAAANALADSAVAFLPVHLFGQCADVDAFDTSDRDLVEDAAQAVGATYKGRPAGGLGLAGCFSFYVTKNLGAAGDAGAATTTDAEVAGMLRSLRAHGEVKAEHGRSYHYERVGRNSRLDGIQAAVLRVKLRRLADWQAKREANAAFYSEALAGVDGVTPPPRTVDGRHVYHQYAIRAARRDDLRAHLGEHGIETRVFYPEPLHTMPALRDLGLREGQFPVAEQACREVLSLPVHAHLSEEDRTRVVEAVSAFYR